MLKGELAGFPAGVRTTKPKFCVLAVNCLQINVNMNLSCLVLFLGHTKWESYQFSDSETNRVSRPVVLRHTAVRLTVQVWIVLPRTSVFISVLSPSSQINLPRLYRLARLSVALILLVFFSKGNLFPLHRDGFT